MLVKVKVLVHRLSQLSSLSLRWRAPDWENFSVDFYVSAEKDTLSNLALIEADAVHERQRGTAGAESRRPAGRYAARTAPKK